MSGGPCFVEMSLVSKIHDDGGHDRWCLMCLYVHFFVFMYVCIHGNYRVAKTHRMP